ncbi:MAG: tetratricopeptide repeat protein [Planctomycetota bacterium]
MKTPRLPSVRRAAPRLLASLAALLAPAALLAQDASAPAAAPAADSDTSADVGPPPQIRDTSAMDPAMVALIAELVEAIEADPKSAAARAELGLAYESNTIWSLAETCYDQSLLLAPDETQWRFRRGIVRLAGGELDAAIGDLRAAADAYKNTPVVQARLGDALRTAGELEEAEAAWRQAIAAEEKQTPVVRYAASRVGLAQVLLDLEKFDEAAELCQAALEIAPGYRHGHYTLGRALMELGQVERAEMELAAGETAFPEFPPSPHDQKLRDYGRGFSRSMMLIENLVSTGQLGEAQRRLAAILESRPDDFMVLNLAARVALRGGDAERARTLLAKSLEVAPGEPATHIESCLMELDASNRLGMQVASMQQAAQLGQQVDAVQVGALRAQGAEIVAQALEHATSAARIAPAVGRHHYWLGVCQQQSATFATDQQAAGESMQKALASFQTALRLGCTEPSFNQQLASLYGQMGRSREMLKFAKRHLEAYPGDANAIWVVVQALLANNRAQEISPYIVRMEEASAGNAQMLQFCVQGYLTVGALDAAETALAKFETAAAGNPNATQFIVAVQTHIASERAKAATGGGQDASGGGR